MGEAQKAERHDAYNLVADLERFISSNDHSTRTELRWLSDKAKDLLTIARQVRSGDLDKVHQEAMLVFRLQEIRAEKDRRQREIDELDREAAQLSV